MRILYALLILTALALPTTIQAEPAKRFMNIQEITTPGGIKAWFVEDHAAPVISMQFAFAGAGSVIDGGKQGIVQLASNTMDEGAGELDSQAFQKTLSDNSISLSYSVGRDDYFGNLKTLSRQKDKAFDLLRLSLTSPRFDAEPLQRMKDSNLARIRSALSDPDWMAARIMNDTVFAGHPYSNNSGGTLSSIQSITADDLRAFVKNFLTRDRVHIAVSGDITRAELETALDKIFGGLPAGGKSMHVADLTPQNTGTLTLYKREIPQTIIMISQAGINRRSPDWQAAQVMNFILGSSGFGSRLMEEVREKRGLTYGIYSGMSTLDHISTLTVQTSTRNEKTAEVLDIIKREWVRMRDTDVTEKELKAAKDYLVGSMPLALTSTDKLSSMMLSLMLDSLPSTYLDHVAQKISAVTVADVRRVAKGLLDPDKMVTVMVGNPAEVKPTKTIEKLPNAE
jgi:zinc protease